MAGRGRPFEGPKEGDGKIQRGFRIHQLVDESITWIAENLGIDRSDAVAIAVRNTRITGIKGLLEPDKEYQKQVTREPPMLPDDPTLDYE